jgi:hypothetical protein
VASTTPDLRHLHVCPACNELLKLVEAATERHIAALSRYQQGAILRALAPLPELEAAMEEAARARAEAVDCYNQHLSSHQTARAGSGA